MRVRGRDLYASYEGSYGVGDDVCATGGAPSWEEVVVRYLLYLEGGIRAW